MTRRRLTKESRAWIEGLGAWAVDCKRSGAVVTQDPTGEDVTWFRSREDAAAYAKGAPDIPGVPHTDMVRAAGAALAAVFGQIERMRRNGDLQVFNRAFAARRKLDPSLSYQSEMAALRCRMMAELGRAEKERRGARNLRNRS